MTDDPGDWLEIDPQMLEAVQTFAGNLNLSPSAVTQALIVKGLPEFQLQAAQETRLVADYVSAAASDPVGLYNETLKRVMGRLKPEGEA